MQRAREAGTLTRVGRDRAWSRLRRSYKHLACLPWREFHLMELWKAPSHAGRNPRAPGEGEAGQLKDFLTDLPAVPRQDHCGDCGDHLDQGDQQGRPVCGETGRGRR